MTGTAHRQHPRFARAYTRIVKDMDARGGAEHRAELAAGLSGSVIEVGCGSGAMFAHYPSTVRRVLAVEPEDTLRPVAAAAARQTAVPIEVVDAVAERLPASGGSFDAAVCALMLCSVDDQQVVLAEIARVLRPGGELRVYEHVRAANRVLAAGEDVITPVFRHFAGNCHPNRDTLAAIHAAGYDVRDARRFGVSTGPLSPRTAHILVTAVPPGAPA